MSEPVTNLAARGVGAVSSQPHRGNLQSLARGVQGMIDNRYPLDATVRQRMVDEAYHLATASSSERVRVAALRVLALLDQVNVRREANEVAEAGHELAAQTDRLRATLSSHEARQALVALTAATCQPQTQLPSQPPKTEARVARGEDWASAGGLEDESQGSAPDQRQEQHDKPDTGKGHAL